MTATPHARPAATGTPGRSGHRRPLATAAFPEETLGSVGADVDVIRERAHR